MDEVPIFSLQKAGIPVKNDGGRSGLMHNKFLVFDNFAVWTGSYNPTENGACRNNNNSIYIRAEELASNFTSEFTEMFVYNQFGKRSPKSIPHPTIIMPDATKIITLFSPENNVDSAIIAQIYKAEESIYFMAFSFTHDGIGTAMIKKYHAGIDVLGVFEKSQSNTKYSEYRKMLNIGIPVKQDSNRWNLHHKVIIIDKDTVITGSFNFSQNATQRNDENLLIIKDNPAIAEIYLKEFSIVYGKDFRL